MCCFITYVIKLIFFHSKEGFYFFNCRIIALQYCVSFCHTSAWIGHGDLPPLECLSHPPHHRTPPGCDRALGLSCLHPTARSHGLSILHVVMYMFRCYSFNLSLPLLPELCPQACSLRRVSTAALQMGSTASSF